MEDEYTCLFAGVQIVGTSSMSPFVESMHACILIHKHNPLVTSTNYSFTNPIIVKLAKEKLFGIAKPFVSSSYTHFSNPIHRKSFGNSCLTLLFANYYFGHCLCCPCFVDVGKKKEIDLDMKRVQSSMQELLKNMS